MNAVRMRVGLAVFVIGLSPIAMAAPACSARVKVPPAARIFAKTSDQSAWSEYRSFDQLPELQPESGMYALYWHPKKKSRSVYIVEPAQGFWVQTRYCFDGGGQLEGMDYEIGTKLGWGHRVEGPAASSGFNPSTVEFFRTKDGKPIAKPAGVGEVPRALKPTLYLSMSDLPFASFLDVP